MHKAACAIVSVAGDLSSYPGMYACVVHRCMRYVQKFVDLSDLNYLNQYQDVFFFYYYYLPISERSFVMLSRTSVLYFPTDSILLTHYSAAQVHFVFLFVCW